MVILVIFTVLQKLVVSLCISTFSFDSSSNVVRVAFHLEHIDHVEAEVIYDQLNVAMEDFQELYDRYH